MSASTANDAVDFVERALGDVLDAFPHDIRSALCDRFVAEYAAPMTREMELVLHKRLTDDEVRHVLFCPTPAQYRYYATLLSLPIAAALSWARVLLKRTLTLFYLQHARNWPLVTEFVLLDGLDALAALLVHTDMQIRGQALDCFVQITSHSAFDWFASPVGYEARVLHSKMLALAAPRTGFLESLIANIRRYNDSSTSTIQTDTSDATRDTTLLPGGSFVLLQVLAFFLSWLRKFYAVNNELRLSHELLTLLRDWASITQSSESAERALAQQVYDDFSRWPALDAESVECDTESTPGPVYCQIAASPAASTSGLLFSRDAIERLLDSDVDEANAIESCTAAIAARMCLLDAHLLRARALTQRIERIARARHSGGSKVVAPQAFDDVQHVLDDCACVLELDVLNVSARKLRVRALAALEMWDEALALLAEWSDATDDDSDALARRLLPDDVSFFRAQLAVATERQRASAVAAARQQRLDALKQAKQEAIFRAILQRDTADRPTSIPTPTPELTDCEMPTLSKSTTSGLSLTATRYKPSAVATRGARIQDPQTERVCAARAFVRRLRRVQATPDALVALLLATPLGDLASAFESALSDDQLFAVADALERSGHIAETAPYRTLLAQSRRLQLALAMAPDAVRARLQNVVTLPVEQQDVIAVSDCQSSAACA